MKNKNKINNIKNRIESQEVKVENEKEIKCKK